MMRALMLLLIGWMLFPGAVWAHSLGVFAYAEGSRLVGSVYFTSGAPAAGASVTIRGPEGEPLAEPTVRDDGTFEYQAERPVRHRVVASTADGHQASWTVPAAEFAGASSPDGDESGSSDESARPASQSDAATVTIERETLKALVERAVAREVGPLRQELHGYAGRVRLGDIIGGIGFIVGLAGAALWWRARRLEAG
jgi:nickel transport protein